MRPLHIFFGILTTAIWGANFIFVKLSLNEFPPFLLCTLRFFFVSIPIIFFIPKPKVAFSTLLMYGLTTYALQFGLLFLGMKTDVPPGLSALILQVQVFFSLFLAVIFLKERLTKLQMLGAIVSFTGLGIIWKNVNHDASEIGFILELACAFSVGISHLITKKVGPVNALSLVTWGCLISIPPLLTLSLIFEGPTQIISSFQHISWMGVLSLGYTTYVSTWVGYGVWSWLIEKYPITSVIPFLLLIPIFGILGSYLVFHESIPVWKGEAGVFIILGLSIHLAGPKIIAYARKRSMDDSLVQE